MTTTRYNPQRALLARFRGDYLHAGEENAAEMVLKNIQKLSNPAEDKLPLQCLDVGSGLGVTAAYFEQAGLGKVVGIDIDAAGVKYAKEKYPSIQFSVGDALNIDAIFSKSVFDIIYFFNSFYALNNQQECLNKLVNIAKPGTLLVIFDYSHLDTDKSHGLKDLAGQPMHPVVPKKLTQWLIEAGWEVVEEIDLTKEYKKWYQTLLDKLAQQRELLVKEFSQEVFDKVNTTFKSIVKLFDEKILGGVVTYAKFKGNFFKNQNSSKVEESKNDIAEKVIVQRSA